MAEKFTDPIRQAFRDIWPVANAALSNPQGKRRMTERKETVSQAVWAMAGTGWLRSRAEVEVIAAARAWAAAVSPDYYVDYPEEAALYRAVAELPPPPRKEI